VANNRTGIHPSLLQGSGGDDATFRPQLTSLIDVMTILLVFLIKSFSVEGNLITPSPDLELPVSTADTRPKTVTTIEVTREAIVAEGEVLSRFESFILADSLTIPSLYEYMVTQKMKGDTTKAGEVLIQSDKEVAFNVLKRVMFSCSRAGFSEFSVLVLEEE